MWEKLKALGNMLSEISGTKQAAHIVDNLWGKICVRSSWPKVSSGLTVSLTNDLSH